MPAMDKQQRGFTLVEAIIVIVIIGVLSAVVAIFIRVPVQSYVDSAGRAEVSDAADLALRRMARELRRALPNSIRVTPDGHAVEFLLTVAGGRYLSSDDGAVAAGQFPLDFQNPSLQFTVVGAMPTLNSRAAVGDFVVVDNLGPGFAPADAYLLNAGGQRNIALIDSFDRDANQAITTIHLHSNPFAAQTPPMASPNQRFQVVRGAVTYFCGAQDGAFALWRVSGYPIAQDYAEPVPGVGNWAMIASHVDHCNGLFDYTQTTQNGISHNATMKRTGLVLMALSLRARKDTDPTITLVDQVHVENTP
jgi:MSHA biogenesis protein MshO